ncbi:MAG TPA: thioredoxin-dependent thiol peroxidase [Anaerolineales bacterium]|nr:thioredoxin-dependent thiol peroxidase [Anaerolineales bacterium]
MAMPRVGEPAPDFELETDSGETVRLSDFRGRRVVLYFYPRADTPGCTKEACGFRDDFRSYAEKDVVILGVSPDQVRSQAKFRAKYDLPFPLLADPQRRVAEAYGVWGKKKVMGKEVMGIRRTTFLIGEDGKIARIFEGVKAEGHSGEVLAALG